MEVYHNYEMAKSLLSQSPVFIPKLRDVKITELKLQFPAVLMDSHNIEWRPNVAKKIREVSKLFIVNPVTHILMFRDARNTPNFKKLPYPLKVEAEKLYSDASFRTEKLVKPCIEDQLKKGAGIVIAPFLFAEDTDDTKFVLNITMLSESIRYMRAQKINKPLFAMIHIGNSVLTRSIVINYIIDMYTEGFEKDLQGYFIVINDLDCRKTNEETLLGLSKLVFDLSKNKIVFVKRIGAFGEVLSAIGASGFSSGLGTGETLSIKNLQESPKGFPKRSDWIYVPELFDYVNDEEVKKIRYKCRCPACKGSVARDFSSKSNHFLYRRLERMDTLSKFRDGTKRIDFMINCLEDAIKRASYYIKKYGSPLKTGHLVSWRNILESTKTWSHEDADDMLSKLLSDLESTIE